MEKIVLVAPALDLRESTVYTLTLARELKLRGWRVWVMAAEGALADELAAEKIPFVPSEISGVFWRDVLYLNRFGRQIKQLAPELLHVTHHHLAALGGLLARTTGLPYVLTLHSPVKRPVPYQRRHLKGAVAISQRVRESAVNTGRLPRERVHIIENGVATDPTPPARNDTSPIPVVGTMGRLEKDRGIKYFIRAARELVARKVQAHFLVVGSGPDEPKIRRLVRKSGITEHITIVPAPCDPKNLAAPMDIFVCPDLSEGFGIFLLHAMAHAVPVVASAAGGVFSLITDGETGLIVPKREVALFADKIQALLKDRAFAEKIGIAGFQLVRTRFPVQKTLEKTLNLYNAPE